MNVFPDADRVALAPRWSWLVATDATTPGEPVMERLGPMLVPRPPPLTVTSGSPATQIDADPECFLPLAAMLALASPSPRLVDAVEEAGFVIRAVPPEFSLLAAIATTVSPGIADMVPERDEMADAFLSRVADTAGVVLHLIRPDGWHFHPPAMEDSDDERETAIPAATSVITLAVDGMAVWRVSQR
jgi:hypothetical protein